MIDPVFEGIVGHQVILEILTHSASHPAHAYLLAGPDGVGKRLVAERFARLLLEEAGAHGHAPLRAHPDFFTLEREEDAKELKVKQARELLQKMSLTAARGGRKVALIPEADRLNGESANALLKTLEEPAASVVYILVAEEPERLPATLRSRLVIVNFGRVPTQEIADWMKDASVATAARGCPGLARRILDDPDAWRRETTRAEGLVQTLACDPLPKQFQALEQLAQTLDASADPDASWRQTLSLLMRECSTRLATDPVAAARLGHGLLHAWQLAGTSLSPRLALEFAAVLPYAQNDLSIPSFLEHAFLC